MASGTWKRCFGRPRVCRPLPLSRRRSGVRAFLISKPKAGRINFKFGLEKSFFALTEADFALWSPTENEWRMRLRATPFRTDTNISDTGTLRAEGSFRRAQLLRDMPMQMRINWSDGQLGRSPS